jgi:NAD(P)H-dependent FMN reductase
MALAPVSVLLVSGSLRAGSTNAAVLRTAEALTPDGVETVFYSPPRGGGDARRRGPADALLVCTPEYAGALPGALKNLLEWTVGDAGTYEKPVGWINAAGPAAPTGAADAHESLPRSWDMSAPMS